MLHEIGILQRGGTRGATRWLAVIAIRLRSGAGRCGVAPCMIRGRGTSPAGTDGPTGPAPGHPEFEWV